MKEERENPWLRGSKIFSIFGQIEEVIATSMIEENKGKLVPLDHFPPEKQCPNVWQDADGNRAKFAILLPVQRVKEFEDRIRRLRG